MLVEYSIKGYEIIEKDVNAEEGRGPLVYVREDLFFSEIDTENLCIKVKCKAKDILTASIYRSPNSTMADNDRLLNVMKEISHK